MSALLSRLVVSAVGLTCKAAFFFRFCPVTVNGLHNLDAALANPARNSGQGVVTVSNHISTLDDPVTWGVLPARYYLSSRTTRWTLGASEVMFTNPFFSHFFRLGQTLETFRGKGVHQPAVDTAIQKLNKGDWIHLYGEGKINQPETYPQDEHGVSRLPRFKWGVGRILMETSTPPVIIPMWLTGFDKLMPEGRAFPYKYLPRPGTRLSVTFGTPIPPEEIQEVLSPLRDRILPISPCSSAQNPIQHQLVPAREPPLLREQELLKIRTAVTTAVQRRVESLGRSVSGDAFGR